MSECRHRPECPGCPWLEVPYAEQLLKKRESVLTSFQNYRDTLPWFDEIHVHNTVMAEKRRHYRSRTKWVVDGSRIGLYGTNHHVVDTPECLVAPTVALQIAQLLRNDSPDLPWGSRLVAVDIRTDRDEKAVVTLILEGKHTATDPEIRQDGARIARMLMTHLPDDVLGVAVSIRAFAAATVLGDSPRPVAGQTEVLQRVGRVAVYFPAGVFSQVHPDQADVLQTYVRDAVSKQPGVSEGSILDLYAGTGSHGLAVSDLARRTLLVESFEPAAEAAWRGAKRLPEHLSERVEVWAQTAEDALTELDGDQLPPWVVIANPPRSGLSADTLFGLIRLQPDRIVMVSCFPETLVRDMALLGHHGYRPKDAVPIDLIPETPHVETVVTLQLGAPPMPRIVVQHEHWLVVDKPPLLPTIPHPEWPWSVLEVIRDQFPDYQPFHRLDVGTSGLVVLGDPARCSPLVGAQKTYVALVKGITHKGGNIHKPIRENGKENDAHTRYKRVDVIAGHSLVEVSPQTGRTHQIRKHFAAIGHPVLGDDRYGDKPSNHHLAMRAGLIRPFLHATKLSLENTQVTSPLWPDLAAVLTALRT